MKEEIIRIIRNNKIFRKSFLKFSIWLNNISYSLIKLFVTPSGELHPKHAIMNYHKFFVDNVSHDDIVLDIGCGNGALSHDVSKKAKRVIGIDREEENIKKAQEKFKSKNLKFISGDATAFNFFDLGIEKFDKIILSNVLEHIEERIRFLNSLHGLADTILLRVPMLSRDWLSVYKKENNYRYKLSSDHYIEYTKDSLKRELEKSGWRAEKQSVQFGETWAVLIKKD